jgi:hypothetical protein
VPDLETSPIKSPHFDKRWLTCRLWRCGDVAVHVA